MFGDKQNPLTSYTHTHTHTHTLSAYQHHSTNTL